MPCSCATGSRPGTRAIGERGFRPLLRGYLRVMRTMLILWIGVIVTGVVLFSIIGLSHH